MFEYYMVFDQDIILHCNVEDEQMARALGKAVIGHVPQRVQKRHLPYEKEDAAAAVGFLTERAAGRRGYIQLGSKSTWADAEKATFVEWLTRQEKIDRLV